MDNSHSWTEYDPENGTECNNDLLWDTGELDGACAIGVNESNIDAVIKQSHDYYGAHLYLIAADSKEMGEDEGEYIMQDAIVLGGI